MAFALKPGTRLGSVTCTTEIVVVRSGPEADLRCGGEPMVEIGSGQEPAAEPSRGFEQGTQIGKRYADDQASLEVLCTKGGAGSLSLGSTLLVVEGAKPLPASD